MIAAGRTPKAVHLTSVHPPTDVRIVYRECATLAQAGYRVVLVAATDARPVLPHQVGFHPVPPPRNRIERMTSTMWRVFRAARSERADVYHFHDPELIFAGLALRALGARVVFDVHEDIPSDILDKPWIPPLLRPIVRAGVITALRVAERAFSAIVAATPSIAGRFARDRTVIVANFPRLEMLEHATLPFAGRPRAVAYVGSITRERGIEPLVRAMQSPHMPDGVRLVLAGDFEDEALERQMRGLPGWNRVDYYGRIAPDRIAAVLSGVRAGLVPLLPMRNFIKSMPTKMLEYLGAGLPVIASSCLEAARMLTEHDCGILVEAGDPDAIARAIRSLVDQPEIAQAMGERGQYIVNERYQWTSEARKLTNLYARIA